MTQDGEAQMLTQAKLKEHLHYNPTTGVFTHKKLRTKIGKVFGHISKGPRNGYIRGNIGKTYFGIHKLAFLYMEGYIPEQVDHINHDKVDNRWINLREATSSENHRNSSLYKCNKSGFCGVGWHKASKKWRAYITINNKSIQLGVYSDIDDAIDARKKANIQYNFHENHGI